MADVWFSSDPHFSHNNIIKFTNDKGELIRPFATVHDMDEYIIERHNSVVKQTDKWYCLGDVGFNRASLERILPRLNGHKRLILGNHDRFDMRFYTQYFAKVMESWQPEREILFTHRPVLLGDHDHHDKVKINVHGHVHQNTINDPRYLNLSMEAINYTPVNFDTIHQTIKERNLFEL